ncbi:serine protease snake-like isoform X1 [Anoplophora glabripennis]|uniref:serine protease snake-like isoform X1 n=1 Tax=Anoplophora glabripennis TaxID=217634 RepID=UPI000C76E51F|nr:serine protease snake-like isoform X1 [Anoplophora glabripennis]
MSARFRYNILVFVVVISTATLCKGDKCSFKDGSEGKCKLLKECPTAVQQIKTKDDPVICGINGTELIVCCKDEDVMEMVSTTTITSQVPSRTPGDISKQKCKEYSEYAYEKIQSPTLLLNPYVTKKLECDIQRNRLVVGSTLAARREFPHMALIGYQPSDEIRWLCGGSLISENFVLTSAVCLFTKYDGYPKLVRIGFTNKTDPTHMQERTVSEIIPHPKHNNKKYHDIGLLKLSKDVKFSTYVRPACLQTEYYIPHILAIASGWGSLNFTNDLSNDLLATVLEFYSVDECNNTYRRYIRAGGNLENGIVDDLMICAGISKSLRSTCQGDGGGPLQVYHQETDEVKCMYDIIGVTSFGKPCGLAKNIPDVFTRVSAYIKWIEDIVWPI